MNLPKWLADEINELARRVKRGELDREQAVETLRDDARKKSAPPRMEDREAVERQVLWPAGGLIKNKSDLIDDVTAVG